MFDLNSTFYSEGDAGSPETGDPEVNVFEKHLIKSGILRQEEKAPPSKEAAGDAPESQKQDTDSDNEDKGDKRIPFERFQEVYSERSKYKTALEEILANPEIKAIITGKPEAKPAKTEPKKDTGSKQQDADEDAEWLKTEVSKAVRDTLKELGLADMAKATKDNVQKAEAEKAYRGLVKEMTELYPDFDEDADMPVIYATCEELGFKVHPKVAFELAKSRGKISKKDGTATQKQAHDIKGGKPPAPEKEEGFRKSLSNKQNATQREFAATDVFRKMIDKDPLLKKLVYGKDQE